VKKEKLESALLAVIVVFECTLPNRGFSIEMTSF
jgi:hypothetical protein